MGHYNYFVAENNYEMITANTSLLNIKQLNSIEIVEQRVTTEDVTLLKFTTSWTHSQQGFAVVNDIT